MAIHHDKMAYGKIKPLREETDESRLAAMLKQLSGAEEEAEATAKARTDCSDGTSAEGQTKEK